MISAAMSGSGVKKAIREAVQRAAAIGGSCAEDHGRTATGRSSNLRIAMWSTAVNVM